MGLTKQYLRWVPAEKFGLIGSQCKAILLLNRWSGWTQTDRIVATAACEDIAVWDVKTCQLVERIQTTDPISNPEQSRTSPISCLSYNCQSNVICSGHNDGTVRLFDCASNESGRLKIIFSGHRGYVSCLAFDVQGLRIASGGKDTEIVIWDVINQSGLFRLKGHKGAINCVEFMKTRPWILLSASSDMFIKFWDLNTQHCFRTLVGHRTEIWSFVLLNNDTRLISGGSDSELKVWNIIFDEDSETESKFQQKLKELKEKRQRRRELLGEDSVGCEDDDEISNEAEKILLAENVGSILRKSTERLLNIFVDHSERLLVCHGKDNYIECFKIRNFKEIQQKVKKRLRKERKRRLENEEEENDDDEQHSSTYLTVSDEFERIESIICSSKIRSLDLMLTKFESNCRELFKIFFLLYNNSIECHQVCLNHQQPIESEEISQITSLGHRTDVRTLSISSDSLSILTASSDSVKLWNKSSCRCVNTIRDNVEYPLCSLFAPGDKHAVLGTKSGKIQVISLTSAQVQSTIEASDQGQPIWSICLFPDLTGIVSGSEDKTVKFWNFDLVIQENQIDDNSNRILTLNHERTLTVEEGVICTKVSPNSKFVAVAMLDSCVKIYFCDTLKFFLSLYGHKLPVLCMDISSDNSLIVTGSSDKNIKIWGMDFGDCHRSLFAHDDNIMAISFVPKTHHFFTASKDHRLKMWDADNYEKVQTLEGHHGEIWTMAIAPNGKYLVTASHDKSIRLWSKTQEPLVLHEEQEMEHEREFERELEQSESHTVVPGESTMDPDKETGTAQKKTTETIRTVERLIESIDVFLIEVEKVKLFESQQKFYEQKEQLKETDGLVKPVRQPVDPHMLVFKTECPYRFMLEILTRIKSNELEETLLQLPFYYIHQLLLITSKLLERRWEIELVCRIVCYLIRTNFGQITSSSSTMASLLDQLRHQMHDAVQQLETLAGINQAGLQHFQSLFESNEEVQLFSELLFENRKKAKNKKKKQQHNAAILTWT